MNRRNFIATVATLIPTTAFAQWKLPERSNDNSLPPYIFGSYRSGKTRALLENAIRTLEADEIGVWITNQHHQMLYLSRLLNEMGVDYSYSLNRSEFLLPNRSRLLFRTPNYTYTEGYSPRTQFWMDMMGMNFIQSMQQANRSRIRASISMRDANDYLRRTGQSPFRVGREPYQFFGAR